MQVQDPSSPCVGCWFMFDKLKSFISNINIYIYRYNMYLYIYIYNIFIYILYDHMIPMCTLEIICWNDMKPPWLDFVTLRFHSQISETWHWIPSPETSTGIHQQLGGARHQFLSQNWKAIWDPISFVNQRFKNRYVVNVVYLSK